MTQSQAIFLSIAFAISLCLSIGVIEWADRSRHKRRR